MMERTIPYKIPYKELPVKKKQYYHIYKITNIVNGKCYIGSAVRIIDRWRLHEKMLKSNIHHSIKLQRAWNKYKEMNFTFEILDSTSDKKRLIPDEQYWMDMYDSVKYGYNVSPIAGSQLGFKHSAKSRLLIGQVQKGRVSNRKGVHLSEETKKNYGKQI